MVKIIYMSLDIKRKLQWNRLKKGGALREKNLREFIV